MSTGRRIHVVIIVLDDLISYLNFQKVGLLTYSAYRFKTKILRTAYVET